MSETPKLDGPIRTVDMHIGGEALRIVKSGYPPLRGNTLLEKRRDARERLDHFRKFLMFEPRGHYDMYGCVITEPDMEEADFAVLFLHNEGYSTMCGHAVICLARYAVDSGIVPAQSPRTNVNIQCPCGLVRAVVDYDAEKKCSGQASFRSVPAFLLHSQVEVATSQYGSVTVDVRLWRCILRVGGGQCPWFGGASLEHASARLDPSGRVREGGRERAAVYRSPRV